MLVTTSPVTVLSRKPYSDPDSPDPIVWGKRSGAAEGQLIEKLTVFDPATSSVLDNLTLDPAVNGAGSVTGEVVRLTCEVTRESVPAQSRSGRDYVAVKDKWRVVKVEPVSPAPSPKS
jgi:hypothetical protein